MAQSVPEILLQEIARHWGWEVGDKVRQEIEAVIGAHNVDIDQLQSAIQTIQGLLDADPDTPEFDVGQNIITQLTDHLTRIVNLENKVATLNGDENTAGSVAYAVKQERDRAQAVEANLQSQIDDNAEAINILNGDETVEGSVAKQVADAKVEAKEYADNAAANAANAAEANAKAYANENFVSKEALANISATILSSIFRQALDCGFSGAPKDDVLNGTGDCVAVSGDGGDGAVI